MERTVILDEPEIKSNVVKIKHEWKKAHFHSFSLKLKLCSTCENKLPSVNRIIFSSRFDLVSVTASNLDWKTHLRPQSHTHTHTHTHTRTHTHTHTHTPHTHTHVGFYGLRGLSIGIMVFILYKLYVLLPYTYPTPKLSPHRRRCISTFPKKNLTLYDL